MSNKHAFIIGLPVSLAQDELEGLLQHNSLQPINIRILRHRISSSQNIALAMLEMETPEEADRAVKALHGKEIQDHCLFAFRDHSDIARFIKATVTVAEAS